MSPTGLDPVWSFTLNRTRLEESAMVMDSLQIAELKNVHNRKYTVKIAFCVQPTLQRSGVVFIRQSGPKAPLQGAEPTRETPTQSC